MTVRNDELAAQFEEMADLLEAQNVEYKPVAYRRAAENIREYPENVAHLSQESQSAVERIDRVGEAIAEKIVEYVETGTIAELEELRDELPVDMAGITSVEGVGPKTVGTLYEALDVRTLDDLETAAREANIRDVKGFGPKTEENILANIDFARESRQRQLLGESVPLSTDITAYLSDTGPVDRCDVAGSLRRWRSTIGDIDVLVASADAPKVVEAFTDWPDADEVIEAGTSKASVRSNGVRVDLRVVVPDEFGAALQYFTGSRDHNIAIRNRAIDRGLKINEYGVFDITDVDDPDAGQRVGERIAGKTEADVYETLDLPLIPAELREARGEIEAAATDKLPELISVDDIRGDLHLHTEWSDGRNSIEEMVAGAEERGYEYLCITDHASGPGMVGGVGLSDDELEEQLAVIRETGDDAAIEVFAGVETNIDENGSVSTSDAILEQLDCVVASPHFALDGDGTDRLIAAAEHPDVDIIGHPTGRQLNRRSGLDIDVSKLANAAARTETALEINANPHRLDLRGGAVQVAVEMGATVVIDTDAHRPSSYDYVRYGVHTARRGWAEPTDVLTTWNADAVRTFFES
ncbi:DNA polymerase/3'-5' exonuclease PolX [Halocatena marina]|uniref:DNA polymerase/3'-5' exonuclease PolX n=1 Tax=Halocatena marina TaxID=2934937 RepID=UPI00200C5D29|nr:DNA polymerase/3'-5' exonuclease PolX [Halocatena marina]